MTEVILEPWRMLTSVFLHSTSLIFHILLNMYTLWIFGRLLEPMLGRGRFLALYLISGLAGSIGVVVLAAPNAQVLGASGAIFGLMGAFLVIQRRLGGNMTQLLHPARRSTWRSGSSPASTSRGRRTSAASSAARSSD